MSSMSEGKNYVVYCAKFGGEVLYVGSGVSGRELHCVNGMSHVYELNRLHFKDEKVIVEVLNKDISRKQSRQEEIKYIKTLMPTLNKNHAGENIRHQTDKMKKSLDVFNKLFGDKKYLKYRESIKETLIFIGLQRLGVGVELPSIPHARRYLKDTLSKTFYEKLKSSKGREEYSEWIDTVFDIKINKGSVWLKFK